MENNLEYHIERLQEIKKEIRQYDSDSASINIINGLKMEAMYHSTSCTTLLMGKLDGSVSQLQGVMNNVKITVNKSDRTATLILAAAVITLVATIVLFVYDDRFKSRLETANESMNIHIHHIDSLLTKKFSKQ